MVLQGRRVLLQAGEEPSRGNEGRLRLRGGIISGSLPPPRGAVLLLVEEAEGQEWEGRQVTVEKGGVLGHDVAPVPARRSAADDVGSVGESGQDRREGVVRDGDGKIAFVAAGEPQQPASGAHRRDHRIGISTG
jgi:hypothetical protein